MPKYRKKPVVIEAFQMTRERRQDNSDWPSWMHEAWNKNPKDDGALMPIGKSALAHPRHDQETLVIMTLEGTHQVAWGDYIIQGVKGELYPCKPDIFEATYEAAD